MSLSPAAAASLLMLISALTHALVGAIMKRREDKLVFRGILGLTSAAIVLPFAFFAAFPPLHIWVWLALGAGLHFTYQLCQIAAFNRADMGLVYPVMRGSAPALVAVFAFFILKESLSPLTILGLGIVTACLIGFGWQGAGAPKGRRVALIFAGLCGALTAGYTVIDAKGIRLFGDQLSYLVWFFLIDGIGIALIAAAFRRGKLITALKSERLSGIAAGVLSLISYGAALIALSLAPVAKLAALRETSVIFGAVLAVLWLKEGFGARRTSLAFGLAFGLILMQMG